VTLFCPEVELVSLSVHHGAMLLALELRFAFAPDEVSRDPEKH